MALKPPFSQPTPFSVAEISDAVPSRQGARPANRNVTSDQGLPATEQERRSHETLPFSFHGRGETLFGIQIVNVLLTLMTLGWYHFWAKAKVRRYLFSQTECAGDRFAYHGTGKELFTGFLKAIVVFGIPYFCLAAAAQFIDSPPWISLILRSLGGILLFLYVPIAMVAARRYRCSRASWRGIRLCFHGRTWDFLLLYFTGWLFTAISLGIYYPYFLARRYAFLVSHTSLGTQPFTFDGHGRRSGPTLCCGAISQLSHRDRLPAPSCRETRERRPLVPFSSPYAGSTLDLVPGSETQFSLGPYVHCLVPFSFHSDLATTPHALFGKCGTPLADRRNRVAVGHRQKRWFFVEQPDATGSSRPRAHPPECRPGLDHR